ncbi:MAG TPA: pectin acetylesterase-family hydrolase [Dehalococcoidia bacterium]|nr:pectin acetylesterase-family hydrolase [Dehalococcoidia bacterium]
MHSDRFAVTLTTCGAILALGLLAFTCALMTTSSEAQSGTTDNPSTHQFAGEPPNGNLSTADGTHGVMAPGVATPLQTPTLPPGWTKIEPGGETICSLGTPYAFWVHPGTVNRLVVYFQGGGACWDDSTCSAPGGYYDPAVEEPDNPANYPRGMTDLDNPQNPFKDWFQVFVPYCTADIHWGNQSATYHWSGADHIINHKGFTNVSAVLDWIQANFEEPEKLLVTGCSAGAYGSVMGAAHLHNLYPDTPLYQLGDSGAGVMTESFLNGGFSNWGAVETIPDWIPGLQIPWQELTLVKLYTELADYYPSDRWSQYNTVQDQVQTVFYILMGGNPADWSQLMMSGIEDIEANAASFHAYLAPGSVHCITPLDIFYTLTVNDVRFVDWLDAMVNDEPWDSVKCAACETDPETPTPTPPLSVGGTAELPEVADSNSATRKNAALAAVGAATLLALAAGVSYARRRRLP